MSRAGRSAAEPAAAGVRPPRLSARGLRLRPVEERDVATLCAWVHDAAEAHLWRGFAGIPVRHRFEQALRSALAHDLQHMVAERSADGSLVGWFVARDYSAATESCEFDVYVPPGPGRRAGEGIIATGLFFEHLFRDLTVPLRRVIATSYAYNLRSQRVLAKVGFVPEHTARQAHHFGGRYHDVDYLSLLRSEWEALPTRARLDRFFDRQG